MKVHIGLPRSVYLSIKISDIFILQFARNLMMKSKRNQRWLEYLAGKREWNTVYLANGPPGVYLDPCPNPRDKIMFDPPA